MKGFLNFEKSILLHLDQAKPQAVNGTDAERGEEVTGANRCHGNS